MAHSISIVSQAMHSPFKHHIDGVNHILRHLKGTPGKGLFIKRTQKDVEVFIDTEVISLREDPQLGIVQKYGVKL